MAGVLDYIKEFFRQETIKNMGYAVLGGFVGAVTGGVIQRALGKTDQTGRLIKFLGSLAGGALTAWAVDRFLHDRVGAYWALFGSAFPPVYEWVTETINPDEYANKIAQKMGIAWSAGAQAAMGAPVVVEIPASTTPQVPQEQGVKFLY